METRANYVLIGAFALAGFIGIIGFFLWFARIELDRQFAYYDIDFGSVSGLGQASDVRFAGLPVGQVVDVRLSPAADGRVRVRVEIDSETPVRTDSIATIEAQGVTGVSFVGISAGSPDAPLLEAASGEEVPMIEAGQSVLQSLSEDAPRILSETLGAVRDLRQLVGGANQRRIEAILGNVESSSAAFALALDDFSQVSASVADFASEIGRFNTTLDSVTGDVSGVLAATGTTLANVDALTLDARALIAEGSDTLDRAEAPLAAAERYVSESLDPTTRQIRDSVARIEARLVALGQSAEGLMQTYAGAGEAATARLTEARETLAAVDALIGRMEAAVAGIDAAARGVEGLVADGAAPLVADLRTAASEATAVIRTIGESAETDLPAILADVRAAARSVAQVVEQAGGDLTAATGRLDGLASSAERTLETAGTTFATANATLAAIDAALETGGRTLEAAERAFAGADRVITEEVAGIAARLRETLESLEAAVGTVAGEIPAVAEELRATSRSAEAAFSRIERTVADSAPAVDDFATNALPQYGRLAAESRALIGSLDALVDQIRRDPSRFFLDPRTPEFRR